jgi:hypothetical protein
MDHARKNPDLFRDLLLRGRKEGEPPVCRGPVFLFLSVVPVAAQAKLAQRVDVLT